MIETEEEIKNEIEPVEPENKKRRGKKTFVFTPEMIEEVEILSGRGLTQRQIAGYYGISIMTLAVRLNDTPGLYEAWRRGKSKTISYVASQLLNKIKSGNTSAMIFYLKTQGRWKDPNALCNRTDEEAEHDPNASSELSINTSDPNEAAKIYQQIMLRGKNE